ncbi:MAG: Gmad2 immunoglobulin-like domain-containing protein [Candidatus Peribacteraceae bacterium]
MRTTFLVTSVLSLTLLAACSAAPNDGDPVPPVSSSSAASEASVSSVSSVASTDVTLTQPQPGDTVSSPLTVSGEARGRWFFEASFPVKLLDGDGAIIAQGIAEAQGDWMTADFVPFMATLTFDPPATSAGTLVLERDNPSGLPENDASVQVPVQF